MYSISDNKNHKKTLLKAIKHYNNFYSSCKPALVKVE